MAPLTTLSLVIVIILVSIVSVGIVLIIHTLVKVLKEKREKRSNQMPELSESNLINIQTNSLLSQLELNHNNYGRINSNNTYFNNNKSDSKKQLSRISSNSSLSGDHNNHNTIDNSSSSPLKHLMNNRNALQKTIPSEMDDYIEQGRISSADLTLSHQEVHRQHDRATRMSSFSNNNNNNNSNYHHNISKEPSFHAVPVLELSSVNSSNTKGSNSSSSNTTTSSNASIISTNTYTPISSSSSGISAIANIFNLRRSPSVNIHDDSSPTPTTTAAITTNPTTTAAITTTTTTTNEKKMYKATNSVAPKGHRVRLLYSKESPQIDLIKPTSQIQITKQFVAEDGSVWGKIEKPVIKTGYSYKHFDPDAHGWTLLSSSKQQYWEPLSS